MLDEHCDLCDLPKATCVHGLPKEVPKPKGSGFRRSGDAPIIEAKIGSTCSTCSERIHPGDWIAKDDDDAWVHAECA